MVRDDTHRAVLLEEVLEGLCPRPGGVYVDATYGRGGHAAAVLERIGPAGRLLAIDKDPEAVAAARERFADDPRVASVHGSFETLEELVDGHGYAGRVNGILLDLGVSSPQLEEARRGFSFLRDGPLDMRMDPDRGESAAAWLARVDEGELTQVIRRYGEERYARNVARAIVAARARAPITRTGSLAEIIAVAVPSREPGKHPATRTFQAIRIFINRELEVLAACLPQAVRVLAPGARLAMISFHSLEDRLVKRFLRDQARGDRFPPDLPVSQDRLTPTLRLVGRARRPGEAEVARNPRARSAVLRVAERLP
ncbi:MAG: 16S rRNA (cytosine(1402)-N(4))-methyltransferase [Chromatiales bacterium 21-64-14]|nr:MAG: 16S rRNA (cytosine(1402)-N(4))-methyltransferase [Chromatiales bacterium 21-64-14]HQU14907.1 16S rRNA (cytosine(1402)-N(4))-methyltransferase RsmH [Gammaproteobacteria bacterium]